MNGWCGDADWMPAYTGAKTLRDVGIVKNERYGGIGVLMMHGRIKECRRKKKKITAMGFIAIQRPLK